MESIADNPTLLAGSVAFFLPVILAAVMQLKWSPQVRSIVAFVVCVLVAVAIAYVHGNLDGPDVVQQVLVILTVAQATYVGFWKPSGVTGRIASVTEV